MKKIALCLSCLVIVAFATTSFARQIKVIDQGTSIKQDIGRPSAKTPVSKPPAQSISNSPLLKLKEIRLNLDKLKVIQLPDDLATYLSSADRERVHKILIEIGTYINEIADAMPIYLGLPFEACETIKGVSTVQGEGMSYQDCQSLLTVTSEQYKSFIKAQLHFGFIIYDGEQLDAIMKKYSLPDLPDIQKFLEWISYIQKWAKDMKAWDDAVFSHAQEEVQYEEPGSIMCDFEVGTSEYPNQLKETAAGIIQKADDFAN